MRHRVLQVATWAISRLAPRSEREALWGDLAEEYELRARAATSAAALRWYRQQLCASIPPLLWARVCRASWLATTAVALLAYFAVGVVEFVVNRGISRSSVDGASAYDPLGMLITFPIVVLVGYLAERVHRGAAFVLGAMMLLAVIVMTATSTESVPLWYRIAYLVVGPAAVSFGSVLRSLRMARSL
jgi:hypothetical protein